MKTRLEMAAVSKRFGTHQVLDQVWLHVRSGEAVGLLGRNGAGKTTMMRIAAGLVRPDAGQVRWPPVDWQVPGRLCYYGGEMTLPPGVSARRWASLFGVTAAERRPIGRLSRGSRQSLGLRVVLSGAPADLILLDEPWEGLDPSGAAWLSDVLQRCTRAGSAILVSSHRLYELNTVCTRFVMLDGGRCEPLVEREQQPRLEQIERAFARPGRS
jgi:ABC-2 type transport system ATP-binding protein